MAIAEDASQPAPVSSAGASVTTASFTPVAGSLIVAIGVFGFSIGASGGLFDATISDSLGSTWTLVQDVFSATTRGGAVRIWALDAGGSPSARTVTAYGPGEIVDSGGTDLSVRVLTGTNPVASAIGALASSFETNVAAVSLTTTTAGSLVVGGFLHDTSGVTLAATSNDTVWLATRDNGNAETRATWRATALTGTPGTSSYGFTNTFTGSSNLHNVVEILPLSASGNVIVSLVNTAEGGVSGAGASPQTTGGASQSPFDLVTITQGAFVFDSSRGGAHGLLAYGVTTNAAYGVANAGWASSSLSTGVASVLYARAYVYLDSWPTTRVPVISFGTTTPATQFTGYVGVRSDGLLALLDASANEVGTSVTAVPIGQWVRIEAKCVANAVSVGSSLQAMLYAQDNVTPIETLIANNVYTYSSAVNQIFFGVTISLPNGAYWLDDVGVSRNGYLGPALFPRGNGTAYDATINSTKTLAPATAATGTGTAYAAAIYVRALRNNFSDNAVANTLALGIDDSATAVYCPSSTAPSGYPVPPFVLRVDYNNPLYEALLVLGGSGSFVDPWIVQRGYQSTTARGHPAGAPLTHQISAADVLGLIDQVVRLGYGTPEGVLAAPVGQTYLRLDGGVGTSLYVKEGGGATAYGWNAIHAPGNPHRYR